MRITLPDINVLEYRVLYEEIMAYGIGHWDTRLRFYYCKCSVLRIHCSVIIHEAVMKIVGRDFSQSAVVVVVS